MYLMKIHEITESKQQLDEFIPLAIMGAGAALTAYDAWQMKQAYDRGEISGTDVAKTAGTDAAVTIIGGPVAKVVGKGWKYGKKIYNSRKKAQGAVNQKKDLVVAPKTPKQEVLLPKVKPKAAMHAGMNEQVSYVNPQFNVEWEEANRYPYLEKLGHDGWIELAKTGKIVRVTKDSVKKIGNTGADGSESLDDLEPDKVARLKKAMSSGKVEMPIVVKQPDGTLELVAGNTRLIGLISTQGTAKVWLIDASTLTEYGRIVKGVNTTPDVGPNEIKVQASKFGFKVDKDGRPPILGISEGQMNERGSIGVPISNGMTVLISPHKTLKIKKSTPGKLEY